VICDILTIRKVAVIRVDLPCRVDPGEALVADLHGDVVLGLQVPEAGQVAGYGEDETPAVPD